MQLHLYGGVNTVAMERQQWEQQWAHLIDGRYNFGLRE